MDDLDLKEIKLQAERELKEEKFKAAVEQEKERIKSKKRFWDFFPYRITIIKKEK